MVEVVGYGILPPLVLSEGVNGVILVEDGHHRLVAYWLSGRTKLHKGEYLLVLKESHKRRFGKVADLYGRVKAKIRKNVEESG
jgi:hypothetical protein